MKPNTYTKFYAHCVFTPKGKSSLLTESIRDRVNKYVLNQEEHHKEKKFRDEYLQILNDNGVDYNNDYLFEFYDEN